ncbi:MAG: hypothetical protein P8M72_04805 [Gammaproteobacteria bacterium]|nr:hypothetical protein [Gammaproteobacteria bacterium]
MGRHHGLIAFRLFLAALCVGSLTAQGAEDAQEYYEPGIVLPTGEGREHILRACTRCHTLEGVPAYSKYWGYERWLPMVENMVQHGSRLNEEEKIIVARYLGKYFGTD